MAKKAKISKTQAVRDYLKDHPDAMPVEIVAAMKEQGITTTRMHVSAIKGKLNKGGTAKKAVKKPAVVVAAPAVVEKLANGGTISLEQVKKVACTIRTLGGFQRVIEVLEVIKELGGVKKFRDLAEAMTATSVDDIPF